ncbi:MAG TPA: hypothetical protein VJM81_01275, partial [Rhizorhapis sp.]|nr:hypothetical protein [Rhizorhapis sp.]
MNIAANDDVGFHHLGDLVFVWAVAGLAGMRPVSQPGSLATLCGICAKRAHSADPQKAGQQGTEPVKT